MPADRKKATLIHELTHCYIDNYITHCDKQYTEEDVADIVANSYEIIHEIVEQYNSYGLKKQLANIGETINIISTK